MYYPRGHIEGFPGQPSGVIQLWGKSPAMVIVRQQAVQRKLLHMSYCPVVLLNAHLCSAARFLLVLPDDRRERFDGFLIVFSLEFRHFLDSDHHRLAFFSA